MSYLIKKPVRESQVRQQVQSQETAAKFEQVQLDLAAEELQRINADNVLTFQIASFKQEYDSQVALLAVADAALQSDLSLAAATLTASDTFILNALAAESDTRLAADSDLHVHFTSALASETSARVTADSDLWATLTAAINSETTARINADSDLQAALTAQLASETSARLTADSDLQATFAAALNEEMTARLTDAGAMRNEYNGAIDAEKTARMKADNELKVEMTTERQERLKADSELKSEMSAAINAESAARANAVADLQSAFNASIAGGLKDFTASSHGLVPQPPDSNAEQILVANKGSNLYGWRTVTSSSVYINAVPSQFGTLTFNNATQTPTFLNYDASKLAISGQTSGKNAGTYTATFTPTGLYVWGADNTQAPKNVTWKIDVLKLPKPAASRTEFEYTGDVINLNVSNYNSTYITQGGDTAKSAPGDYSATYTLKSTSNTKWDDNSTGKVTIAWTIKDFGLEKPAANTTAFTYSGDEKTLAVANVNTDYMTVSGTTQATNAGDYSVTYTLKDTSKTKWSDGTTAPVTIRWSIARKMLTSTQSNLKISGYLTYSGENLSPAITNYNEDYHTLGGTQSAINAGSYTITVAPNPNYAWSNGSFEAKELSWSINPRKVTIIANVWRGPVVNSTYSGGELFVRVRTLVSGVSPLTEAPNDFVDVTGTLTATNAGTYNYTITLKDKVNYIFDTGDKNQREMSWTINRAAIAQKYSEVAAFDDVTYDGAEHAPALVDTVILTGDTNKTDAGSYVITATPDDNHTWADGSIAPHQITWNINKRYLELPALDSDTFTYNAAEQAPNILNFDSRFMTSTLEPQINAKSYTCTVALIQTDKKNYLFNDTTRTSVSLNWKIERAVLQIPTLSATEFTYDGDEHSVALVGFDENTMTLSRSAFAGTNAATYVFAFTLNDTLNYIWSDGATSARNVYWYIRRQRLPEELCHFEQSGTIIFTGSRKTVALTNFDATFHYIVSGRYATDAGNYIVNVIPASNYCWADGSTVRKEVPWTIHPRTLELPTADQTEFTYDGESHCPKITGYDSNYMTASGLNEAQTAAGNYSITFTLQDVENTRWADGSTEPFVLAWSIGMTKLDEPSLTGSFQYDGQLHEPALSGFDADTMTISGTQSATNAGTYTVTVALKDANLTQWSSGSVKDLKLTWKIARKPLSAAQSTFSQSGELYFNANLQTVKIANFDGNYHLAHGRNATNAGTYTANVFPQGNYCWNDGTSRIKKVTWTIKPVTLDKPFAQVTAFTFDKAAHLPDVANFNSTFLTRSGDFNAQSAPGDYSITYSIKAPESVTWADGTTADFVLNWSISKLTFELPYLKKKSFLYTNGITRTVTVINLDENYMTASGDLSAKNAGDYSVTVSFKDKDLYQWADGSNADIVLDWKIARSCVLSKAEIHADDFTYSGAEVNIAKINNASLTFTYLKRAGEASIGTHLLKIGGTSKATDAGEYTATLTPTNNFAWKEGGFDPINLTWTIAPVQLDEVSIDGELTYSGANQEPALLNFVESAMTLASTTSATPAGTYTLTVTPKKNYTWQDGSTDTRKLTWKINRKPLTAAQSNIITAVSKPYTGSNVGIAASECGVDVSVVNLVLASTSPTVDIGNYKKCNATPKANYCWADGSRTTKYIYLNIYDPDDDPALGIKHPVITSDSEFTYNGAAQSITVNFNDKFSVVKTGVLSATDAGEYSVTYALKGSYKWKDGTTADKILTWKINPQPLSEKYSTLSAVTKSYTGEPVTVTISNFNALYHEKGGVYTATNVGNYTCTVAPKPNYCWDDGSTDAKNLTWRITQKSIFLPIMDVSYFDYDGKAHSLTYKTTQDIDWLDISGTQSATNAGTYTVTYSLKDKINTCFYSIWLRTHGILISDTKQDITLTWKIAPAQLDKPTADPAEYTYNGISGVNCKLDGFDSSLMTSNQAIKYFVGSYTFQVALKDKVNYCWADGSTADVDITWKINPVKLSVAQGTFAQKDALTFNGKAQSPAFIDGTGNKASLYCTIDFTPQSDAGTYSATIAPVTSGYCWKDGSTAPKSVQWSIAKAKRNYTLPTGFVSSFELNSLGTGKLTLASDDPDVCSVKLTDNIVTLAPGINGSCTITVAQDADTNYLAFSESFNVTIQRSLKDFTWAQIAAFAKAGNLLDYCAIGDTKGVFVKGSIDDSPVGDATYDAVLIGFNHNPDYEGYNRAHFMLGKHSAFVPKNYNSSDSTSAFAGRFASFVKSHADKWLAVLPDDLSAVITACTKHYLVNASALTSKIWWLSKYEIDGIERRDGALLLEGGRYYAQYEYFKNGNSIRMAGHNRAGAVYWWTRSSAGSSYYQFAVTPNATVESTDVTLALGVIPCFTIS